MTGRITGMRGGISGMIQELVVEECGIVTTTRVREDLIQKGIHIVGMTVIMVESEADMKIPGEHLVRKYYFSVSSRVFGINPSTESKKYC